jgi:starch synthase (maltosyl-transferring)
VIIERVLPQIDGGAFPVKRTRGEWFRVSADVFADGHDLVAGVLCFRYDSQRDWQELPLQRGQQDRWSAEFLLEQTGRCEYTLQAWVDRFGTWLRNLNRKLEAGQAVASELLEGAVLVQETVHCAGHHEARELEAFAAELQTGSAEAIRSASSPRLHALMAQFADRRGATLFPKTLEVTVDRERARFGAWYELFPRSCAREPDRHGTLRDVIDRLPEIAGMGFDVLYLTPIHPIGTTHRKGPNNSLTAGPEDPGSPWAIGSPDGGHKSIHPRLGTIADFGALVEAANRQGIELALDLAFQCSPDHPYVHEHPEWFRHRPDGVIKYAENPPKKYEDIYPLNFECDDWQNLWDELLDVVGYWIGHGVKIFRVDNPHTKPFRFWEWLIKETHRRHPEVLFLSEAFTRPPVMRYLAKCGFSQSYTYFTWRNTKSELTEYFTELSQPEMRDALRPNLFVNTPDILHEYLQVGGRPAFQIRLVLAATLGTSYGIYGPPFERCVSEAVGRSSEEYRDSEKYQIRYWGDPSPDSLSGFIGRINQIRRENTALQFGDSLQFHQIDNDRLLAYSKRRPDGSNAILTVVNLDPHHVQSGWLEVPLQDFDLSPNDGWQVHDLISDARYLWYGATNFVSLNPQACPAHLFRIRRKTRTERDFDYYL